MENGVEAIFLSFLSSSLVGKAAKALADRVQSLR